MQRDEIWHLTHVGQDHVSGHAPIPNTPRWTGPQRPHFFGPPTRVHTVRETTNRFFTVIKQRDVRKIFTTLTSDLSAVANLLVYIEDAGLIAYRRVLRTLGLLLLLLF